MNLRKLWRELSHAEPEIETVIGITGYLDCIKPEDMPGSVAWGRSSDGRPFIAIKVTTTAKYETSEEKVLVAFQRYSNEYTMWVLCGRGCEQVAPLCEEGNIPFPDEDKIRNLLRGDTIIGEGSFRKDIGYARSW